MILILDDHPLARQGLCTLIQMQQGGEEMLYAGTVRESILLAEQYPIKLAFVDINLKKESGFDFMLWAREKRPNTKIFVITSSSRQSDFLEARELGVDAYVLKDAFIDEIVYGMKVVEQGGKFYSSALIDRIEQQAEDQKALNALTSRETEVFELLRQGYSNAKISQALYISEGTTKKHISSILSKLNLACRVEAILFATNLRKERKLV